MLIRELFANEKDRYDLVIKHIVQSWEWANAKEATGRKAFRYGFFENTTIHDGFMLTLHSLPSPLTMYNVAHLARCTLPTADMLQSLYAFGQKHNCIYIKIEPNVYGPSSDPQVQEYLKTTRHALLNAQGTPMVEGKEMFTKYNFLLDITKSDEELFANMHEKTRYNIGLAQRKGVKVVEQNDEESFRTYLKLYFETTKRQGYYGHDTHYHQKIWETLRPNNMARILIAYYENTPLTAWMLLNFHNTLYYPYGGSTTKFRNVMASNLMAWEAIQLGKKMGMQIFDMWGAMGTNPDVNDPWYGFHRFKQGYSPTHVEYLGTFDMIINPQMYKVFGHLDKYREKWLRLKAKFR
jgi:lipid II:glycine glycyltransferase (peptidoglycan interpeptide bridge formation enzyme)